MQAGHFYFGEETYLAWMFVDKALASDLPEKSPLRGLERLRLDSCSWRDVLDSARSGSLLFPTQRLLVVESPLRQKENISSPYEKLSANDQKIIQAYFEDPMPETSLIFIFPGRIRKTSALVKFFSSFPTVVKVSEMKPLKGRYLEDWLGLRFKEEGTTASYEAVLRLIGLVGSDLRRLHMEVKKLVTYAGEKRRIDVEEVDQATGWVKSYIEWELANQLEQANYRECLLVVQNLLKKEGMVPVRVLALVTGFFRNLLLVKLRLREDDRTRKEIFREVKPQIQENFRGLYETQFRQLFSLADAFSLDDLRHILDRLSDVDLKLKSTGLSFQTLLEGFLFEYCWMRKYGRS